MTQKRQAPASRLDDARARMYRDLIFDSAEFVFGEKGFDGATMQDIASEAGVSLKTVYARFPGKREIYSEIMQVRGREMAEAVLAARRSASSPVDKLDLGTRAFVEYLFEHTDWLRIHVRSRLSWAVRPKDEVVAALWQDGQDAYAAILREGIDSGVFWDEDPIELAVMVQALTKVQVSQALESGETDAEGVADRLVARLLRLVCKSGIGIREAG
jgi:AcrR family transcriptional regulator